MRKMVFFLLPLVLLASPPCQGQTEIDNLFSLDLSYSLTGLLNQGWGIGVGFEKKINTYLSTKGTLGHMTFLTGIEDVYCTSVGILLFVNYYPLGKEFDKLYIGIGNGCDFMNYFGEGALPQTSKDILINITPKIGWKFTMPKYVMIDVSAGYKFIINNSGNYGEIKEFVNTGLQFRIGFKILFNNRKKEN
ncbi:hypothetical protein PilKf_01470 [Pillotina sp. SPG140]|jgi:hypothetical protein